MNDTAIHGESVNPDVGELVRWAPPGSAVLQIERVGGYDWPMDAWYVRAGGWEGYVRYAPAEGIRWLRLTAAVPLAREPEP